MGNERETEVALLRYSQEPTPTYQKVHVKEKINTERAEEKVWRD